MAKETRLWPVYAGVPLLAPLLLQWLFMERFYDINMHGAMIGLLLGIVTIAFWPAKWWVRIVSAVLYIPLMAPFLFVEGVSMACDYYHSCL